LEWVDWFNNRRLLEPIGNIPPAEAEANFYAALETEAMAAQLTEISLRQTRRGSMRRRCPLGKPFRSEDFSAFPFKDSSVLSDGMTRDRIISFGQGSPLPRRPRALRLLSPL